MIDDVYLALNKLSATTSRTEKINIIRSTLTVTEFINTLIRAYDPFKTYGLTSDRFEKEFIPWDNWMVAKTTLNFKDLWALLDKLVTRELTGDAAVSKVMVWKDQALGPLLLRILDKDLDVGLGVSTINMAFAKNNVPLISVFEAMLAHKYEPWKSKKSFAIQPKLDGMRCLAIIRNNYTTSGNKSVTLLSRNGKPINSAKKIERELLRIDIPDCFLDGELLSGDNNFANTVSLARRKEGDGEGLVYHVFDMMHSIPSQSPYNHRNNILQGWFKNVTSEHIRAVETLVYEDVEGLNVEETIFNTYTHFRGAGYEGAIVKLLDSAYLPGRSKSWLKLKGEETEDILITDVFEGEGKYQGMLGGFVTSKGKVGGGFTDEQRKTFWDLSKTLIGRTIEVEYHELTPDGKFRHPRFVRFRGDKDD